MEQITNLRTGKFPLQMQKEPLAQSVFVDRIVLLAKAVLLLQCLGMYFQLTSGGALQSMLLMEFNFAPGNAKSVENLFAHGVLILGLCSFIKPKEPLLLLLMLMFGFYAVVVQAQGGTPGAPFAPYAYMARIAAPMFLLCCLSAERLKMAYIVLLFGTCVTFFTHGLEALSRHAHFTDYLISSSDNLLAYKLQQKHAEGLLLVIGFVDILAALVALLWQRKVVFAWMALWGLVTALARITSYGIGLYPEVLVRTVHFAGPMFLLLLRNACFTDWTQMRLSLFPVFFPLERKYSLEK